MSNRGAQRVFNWGRQEQANGPGGGAKQRQCGRKPGEGTSHIVSEENEGLSAATGQPRGSFTVARARY